MKKSSISTRKSTERVIDLSPLENKMDQAVAEELLKELQQFFFDLADIRRVNTKVADNLSNSLQSKQAAVFAESKIIAGKVRKKSVNLLDISSTSSDAYYIQEKIGGIYVRLEIKSVTQEKPSAI